jgi:hypothetical protein
MQGGDSNQVLRAGHSLMQITEVVIKVNHLAGMPKSIPISCVFTRVGFHLCLTWKTMQLMRDIEPL